MAHSQTTTTALFAANMAALETAYEVADEGREPDLQELKCIRGYQGWGQLSNVFDEKNHGAKVDRDKLKKLVGTEAFSALRTSVLDSYYTPSFISSSMWGGLMHLGFDGGTLLEPSVGSGVLVDSAPAKVAGRIEWTAIERCPSTAKIFSLSHPSVKCINNAFEDVPLVNDSFSAAILNPPFGETKVYDSFDKALSGSTHNFFMMKTVQKLRDGAVMAAVVSRYFLDATDSTARLKVAEKARLIQAIRLPAGAFSEAGTDVITDILFFEITEDRSRLNASDWAKSVPLDQNHPDVKINQWFSVNPECVLGDVSFTSNQYGSETLAIHYTGDQDALNDDIQSLIKLMPEGVYDNGELFSALDCDSTIQVGESDRTKPFGSTLDIYGQPVQRMTDDENGSRFRRLDLPKTKVQRLEQLLCIRDLVSDLLAQETSTDPDTAIMNDLRSDLNIAYDVFVKKFGPIHGRANSFLKDDPDFGLLLGLELNYEPGISKAVASREGVDPIAPSWKKADIFTSRVCYPITEPERCDNATDALLLSLRKYGKVKLPYMTSISDMQPDRLIEDLSGAIFCVDPVNNEYVVADEYLSGNVREKLKDAQKLAVKHPKLKVNVAALKKVLPPDIQAADISVPVGAPWVPASVLQDFIEHMVDAKNTRPVHAGGTWFFKLHEYQGNYAKQTSQWGTKRRPFGDLIERIVNNRPLTIYDTIYADNGGTSRVVNIEETNAAENKAEEIREAWADWVFTDGKRRGQLTRLYNDLFNGYANRKVDGSFLVDENGLLPGQSPDIELGPHQLNAIWRAILTGNLLCDMAVGSGKTFTAVAAVMEMIRMNLCHKALITVPNHMVTGWRSEIARLYPAAKVLVANDGDMGKQKRRRFIAMAAMGDYDLVIIPHSTFKFIDCPFDYKMQFLEEHINEITDAIDAVKADDKHAPSLRQMEKRRTSLRNKLKNLMNRPTRDLTLTFDKLGINQIVCDEYQVCKNLMFNTSLTNVAGLGNPEGSQMALDVFIKARYLQKINKGRGLISLSGTPISNSVVELWTALRFHCWDYLKRTGLHYLDSWVAVHSTPITAYEMTVDGKYKLKTRLAQFTNVPELLTIYRSIAEVVTKDDLKAMYRDAGKVWPEPEMDGGKPKLCIAKRSPEQEVYMEHLLERAEHMSSKDPREDNFLKLSSDACKASLDMRLIDPALPDYPNSKINLCVSNVFSLYKETRHQKGTQLVFCDLSTPSMKSRKPSEDTDNQDAVINLRHCVYDDIKEKLISCGIPENEIAFIHDAKTGLQKQQIIDRMNRGEIAVLLASSETAGAGTNCQMRLTGIHCLDCPWRPDMTEQRLGRGLRQGNLLYEADPKNFKMKVYWYSTDKTIDAHRFQTVETKARFIQQLRRGNIKDRVISDIDGGNVDSFGQMKALISGNPLILKHFEIDQAITKLEMAERNHKRNVWSAENFLATYIDIDHDTENRLAKNNADLLMLQKYNAQGLLFETQGKQYTGDAIIPSITEAIDESLNRYSYQLSSGVNLGTINGFEFTVEKRNSTIFFHLNGEYNDFEYSYKFGNRISIKQLLARIANSLKTICDSSSEILYRRDRIKDEMEVMRQESNKAFDKADELKYKRRLLRAIINALADNKDELPEEFSHEIITIKSDYLSAVKDDGENDSDCENFANAIPTGDVAPNIFSMAHPGVFSIAQPIIVDQA